VFSGIVEEVGKVADASPTHLVIQAKVALEGTRVGDSICVNGACLTVVDILADSMSMDVTPETLRRTNLGELKQGDPVHLERALALGDRMGGHMVQGHIESTVTVRSITPEGESLVLKFEASPEVMRYIVLKGFVALDGISMTVVTCELSWFTVSVIPYTKDFTVLGSRRVGDRVNIETDVIARYVERLLDSRTQP